MNLKIIRGNLLEAKESHIAHQCNCVTRHSAGTARSIFDKFPYANTYSSRKNIELRLAGTISVHGNGEDQRFVINMYAQVYPGRPKFPNSSKDGTQARIKMFQECLQKIVNIKNLKSLAFPYKIGCNLAGGDWTTYLEMIRRMDGVLEIPIRIYRL